MNCGHTEDNRLENDGCATCHLHDSIAWRDAEIAKLEKVADAARRWFADTAHLRQDFDGQGVMLSENVKALIAAIEALDSSDSVSDATLPVASQHTQQSGAMLGARASDAASDLEKLAAEWLDKWVYTEPDDQPNLVPVLVRLLKSVRDGACSETAEPEWLETMKQRTRAAEEYARSRDFTSTLPDGEPEKKA